MRVAALSADGEAVCVDEDGSRSTVMADLVGPVVPGDRVLVHAGVALVRLEESA
jgi:hydrogenase maturation factor